MQAINQDLLRRPRVGVGVLIINNRNQLLLGKRKNAHGDSTWAPAGGHLEFGESFESCAKRETYEETGLTIEAPTLVGVTNDFFHDQDLHYVSVFLYASHKVGDHPIVKEPDKIECWRWFGLDDLPPDDSLFVPLHNLLILLDKRGLERTELLDSLVC